MWIPRNWGQRDTDVLASESQKGWRAPTARAPCFLGQGLWGWGRDPCHSQVLHSAIKTQTLFSPCLSFPHCDGDAQAWLRHPWVLSPCSVMVSLGQVAELFLPPVSASADFQRSRVPAVGPCTGHRASAVDSRAPSPAEGVGDPRGCNPPPWVVHLPGHPPCAGTLQAPRHLALGSLSLAGETVPCVRKSGRRCRRWAGASEDVAPALRVSGNYPEWRWGANSWENIPDGGDGLSEDWG